MKRVLIVLFALIFALPVVAQEELTETYEFDDTGTRISYPDGWDVQEEQQLLILVSDNASQAIVIDYPILSLFLFDNPDPTPEDAVASIAEELIGNPIDTDDIYTFEVDDREVTAYDVNLAASGNVFAVEFSNGALGMLITIEIDDDLAEAMLESFDSTEDVSTDVSVSSDRSINTVPSAYIFQASGRFIYPAGWSVEARVRDDVEYAIVSAPDDVTVMFFDLSEAIPNGTPLDEVLDRLNIDWEDDFQFELDNNNDEYIVGDREAISYDMEVDGENGLLIILRFDNNSIAIVALFGDDIGDYQDDINQLIGSFNNLGATLQYIN